MRCELKVQTFWPFHSGSEITEVRRLLNLDIPCRTMASTLTSLDFAPLFDLLLFWGLLCFPLTRQNTRSSFFSPQLSETHRCRRPAPRNVRPRHRLPGALRAQRPGHPGLPPALGAEGALAPGSAEKSAPRFGGVFRRVPTPPGECGSSQNASESGTKSFKGVWELPC